MSSYRSMKALAEDGAAVAAVTRHLLSLGGPRGADPAAVDWTDWEVDFLEKLAARQRGAEPLSMRQREKLDELIRAAERHRALDGFDVPGLVRRASDERFDLDDDEDVEFLVGLKGQLDAMTVRGLPFSVTGRQGHRLLRICRALGLIDAHHGAGWSPLDAAHPSAR